MKTEKEKIADIETKYKDLIFHTNFTELTNELFKRQYKIIGDFVQGKSLFISFINGDSIVMIQMDTQGRVLSLYRKIEYVKLIDQLFNLDMLNNSNKVLHTKPETRKNFITKIINFFEKLENLVYAK